MTAGDTLDFARDAIWLLITLSAPMMIAGLVVGVAIAMLQALTQIQEMTLTFVPKILVVFFVLIVSLPFMAASLSTFMHRIAELIIK